MPFFLLLSCVHFSPNIFDGKRYRLIERRSCFLSVNSLFLTDVMCTSNDRFYLECEPTRLSGLRNCIYVRERKFKTSISQDLFLGLFLNKIRNRCNLSPFEIENITNTSMKDIKVARSPDIFSRSDVNLPNGKFLSCCIDCTMAHSVFIGLHESCDGFSNESNRFIHLFLWKCRTI